MPVRFPLEFFGSYAIHKDDFIRQEDFRKLKLGEREYRHLFELCKRQAPFETKDQGPTLASGHWTLRQMLSEEG